MSRHFLILLIVILTLTAATGGLYEQRRNRRQRNLANQLINKNAQDGELIAQAFQQALNLLDENYVVAPERERVTHGAITGMLHVLDPHSNFFDWREFNEMRNEQNSKFDGIGVTVNQRNGRLYVIGVIPGMPAAKAGLRYGDALVSVNDHPALDWGQGDALKHIRGKAGTSVKIVIERVNETAPLTFEVERAEVPYPSVRNHFMVKPEVGYIALTGGFNQTTSDELRDALDELKNENLHSLILDLRRNPGGLLRQAIQVTELFLPRDTEIVSVKDARYRRVHRSENAAPEGFPLVVLIDGESASASEIVAGAIQDQDRGWIVGVPSFGKGLVQTVFPLPAGTGLTLTTAKYFTASGRSIQREYTGLSFYDYYAERRSNPNGKPLPNPSGQAFYTPTRRAMQSGGGITPDKVVSLPEPDYRLRDACFEFTRRLVAGSYPSLVAYQVTSNAPELRENIFPVTDEMLTTFRDFLRASNMWRSYETRILSQLDAVRRRLRAEILTAHFGVEIGERSLLESDPQVLAAVAEIPQARSLLERARLSPPNANATQH